MKEAWDNMDSGLKQWIITGVSIAISFIPVVGPLISCIVDGTFVDMLTAISSSDWAMLRMCCLAFAPGAKMMNGLKAVGGFGNASCHIHSSFRRSHPSQFFAIKEIRDLNSLLAFEDYSWQF